VALAGRQGHGRDADQFFLSSVHAARRSAAHSHLSAVARAVMCGFGVAGYGLAIDALAQMQ
jgi:3-dehydroquinate dehydratase-2